MDFITNNLEWILPIITGIITWFASRKFKKAELRTVESEDTSGELSNISQNFKVYQELINDLEDRFTIFLYPSILLAIYGKNPKFSVILKFS